jgi:tetratricopeptide (TPR) repeat protein
MPDSFGRMETHCFGCERVFEGKRAQGVAEKVFTQLLAKTPEKPQVHYLMGYLRMSQERYPEALKHLKDAVARDPEYLNAWEHIREVGGHLQLPPDEVDAATFNVLRLDPQGRHVQLNVAEVRNLRKLWAEVEAARKNQTSRSKDALYPLAASKKAQEKIEELQRQQGFGGGMMRRAWGGGFVQGEVDEEEYSPYGRRHGRVLPPPGQVVALNGLIGISAQMIDMERQRRFNNQGEQEQQ